MKHVGVGELAMMISVSMRWERRGRRRLEHGCGRNVQAEVGEKYVLEV